MSSASNLYDSLAEHSVIVCDSGDIESIKKFKPTDATTNPSLILQAVNNPAYKHLVDEAIAWSAQFSDKAERLDKTIDRLCVNFGVEISKLVPGVVSTEVAAKLSYDKDASIKKARELIAMYQEKGVDKSKVLIKLASTWEGIQAAKVLEEEGIHCNMTLLFSMCQAVACANVRATLISPFVGRIMDWYSAKTGQKVWPDAKEDPGVKSVTAIFNYYKSVGSKTIVMGASFRNKEEILALKGCDKLTISPKLLDELRAAEGTAPRVLEPPAAVDTTKERFIDEKTFRWELNEDAMATEKLAEGIRNFYADTLKLEKILLEKF